MANDIDLNQITADRRGTTSSRCAALPCTRHVHHVKCTRCGPQNSPFRMRRARSPRPLFANPRHPYTEALLSAVPVADPDFKRTRIRLQGDVPSPISPPPGCPFHPRCPYATPVCRAEVPMLRDVGEAHQASCHRVEELSLRGVGAD